MTNRHRHTLIKADIPSSPSCALLEVSPAALLRQDWGATPCLRPRKCVPRGHSTGQGGRRCLHWQSNIGLDRFLESNTQIHPILLLDNSKYLYFPPFSLQFWVRKKRCWGKWYPWISAKMYLIFYQFAFVLTIKSVSTICWLCFCCFLTVSDSFDSFWQSTL